MFKRLILSFVVVYFTISGSGQTVVWQMAPTDYSRIERLNSSLFLAYRNGKVGLINADGSIVAPVVNDDISDYYEHKALITSNDGHGERITGCLTYDGSYYGYSTKYYTLKGQKFFSDGLLSVADESGKLGYIDEKGNQIVGFDGKYSRIKPFTEGYATVMKKNKYILIDKEGEEMRFFFGGNGVGEEIMGCTNVYNGISYTYDGLPIEDRTFYKYDAVGKGKLIKIKKVKDTTMDYLFCYQSITGRTKDVPYEKPKPYAGIKGLSASFLNGSYGYVSGDNVIVPYQFTSASQFEDGLAIVGINGRIGILKYVDGACFEVSVPTANHDYYAGNSVSCGFDLSAPSIWNEKKTEVLVRDMNGSAIATTNTTGSYHFTIRPTASGKFEYTVTVNSEDLCLYKSNISYIFQKRERCPTCGKEKSQCEYNGKHPIPTTAPKKTENPCPVCGKSNCTQHCYDCRKPIRECPKLGIHKHH